MTCMQEQLARPRGLLPLHSRRHRHRKGLEGGDFGNFSRVSRRQVPHAVKSSASIQDIAFCLHAINHAVTCEFVDRGQTCDFDAVVSSSRARPYLDVSGKSYHART
jgi:hypothetical protein